MPMGSPLSPIISDIVLQDLELQALNKLTFNISFYFRYVDDTILTILSNQVNHVVNVFNSIHDRLQFTYELQKDNTLNYLDISIKSENNKLICDWYQKTNLFR